MAWPKKKKSFFQLRPESIAKMVSAPKPKGVSIAKMGAVKMPKVKGY